MNEGIGPTYEDGEFVAGGYVGDDIVGVGSEVEGREFPVGGMVVAEEVVRNVMSFVEGNLVGGYV